ncbi:MAG: hypothetical protein BJ554DRAFT_6858 [Olpidium bornovanus]|uniref:Uncharacterized protein n=1 Tax=Olpidium bornovanus TaxID=278681 RepID=A0A8H8DJT5_9FUNG|nr:MAG: hypothetical protein BJ554DRAFT_6858 [Olpidium bornovanus]
MSDLYSRLIHPYTTFWNVNSAICILQSTLNLNRTVLVSPELAVSGVGGKTRKEREGFEQRVVLRLLLGPRDGRVLPPPSRVCSSREAWGRGERSVSAGGGLRRKRELVGVVIWGRVDTRSRQPDRRRKRRTTGGASVFKFMPSMARGAFGCARERPARGRGDLAQVARGP